MAALACSMMPTAALGATADVSYGGGDAIDTKVGIRLTAKEKQMSIDAPVRITIEGNDHAAIDIDKIGADGASSGKVTFVNHSERAAYLAGAEVIQSEQANVGKVFQGSVGSDANPFMKIVADVKNGVTTGQVSTVDPNVASTPMVFDISDPYSGGRRDFYLDKATSETGTPATFDLSFDVSTAAPKANLDQSNLKGNTTSIASVIWTFGVVPTEPDFEGVGQGTENLFLSVNDSLSYEDPYGRLESYKGKTFSLDEVLGMTECLSRYEDASLYYGVFNIMCGPASSSYTCKTTWDATYDVRVIGVLHDDLSDGTGKAGLTFEFKDLYSTPYRMGSSNGFAGKWGASELRANMNPAYLPNNGDKIEGVDSDAVWVTIPSDLQDAIKPVTKPFNGNGMQSGLSGMTASQDKVFLLSLAELANIENNSEFDLENGSQEGTQYAYYRNQNVVLQRNTAYPGCAKSQGYHTRSFVSDQWSWVINANGNLFGTVYSYQAVKFAPSFCL